MAACRLDVPVWSETIGHYRDQNEDHWRDQAARRYKYALKEVHWPKFAGPVECQQHAADVENSDDEKRVGDIAQIFAADNTHDCWDYCDDRVRHEEPEAQLTAEDEDQVELKDRGHDAEVGQATEVSATDDTGEDRKAVDE